MRLPKLRYIAVLIASGAIILLGAEPAPGQAAKVQETCDGDHLWEEHGPAAIEKRDKFEALRDVTLSSKVVDKLNAIATRFEKKTGKTFVVTSGTRAPGSQAELIYSKLDAGEDLLKLYKDKSAISELKKVFDTGRAKKKSKSAIITELETAIRLQIKRGIFISAHLKAGAADVRSSNMSAAEKRAFMEAVLDAGGVSLIMESTPPHFHLQLD